MIQRTREAWDKTNMMALASKLFAKIQRQKRLAHAHHDIHFLSRERDEWLPEGIEKLREGS